MRSFHRTAPGLNTDVTSTSDGLIQGISERLMSGFRG